jgi:hypothetical protein
MPNRWMKHVREGWLLAYTSHANRFEPTSSVRFANSPVTARGFIVDAGSLM